MLTMLTMKYLQQLIKKYGVTKSGNKTEIANSIYSLRSLYLSTSERKILEDFLHITNNKKEKRIRKVLPI